MASRKAGGKSEDFKQEDVLQAVVVADSFNVRFAPLTISKPRTLLPLVNVPLLEYTLEFLCAGGVQQVIVFCCSHADQVKQYLHGSRWMKATSPVEILTVVSDGCISVGDVLRDLDAKSLIHSDFVLVDGDLVSNVKLKRIVDEHRKRRVQSKNALMTMIYKRAQPGHVTRCKEDEVVIALRPETSRIVAYQRVGNKKKFVLPRELFDAPIIQIRYDLLDCHISICSPIVPQLLTDNFDFQTYDDLIRGVLVNEEILGNTLHMHLVDDEYAARTTNILMYDAISQDVMSRWCYPLVPDSNILCSPDDNYIYGRHNVYRHRDVTLARGCTMEENVTIGKGSSVGCNTTISRSVIGKNCTIGENVRIDRCYIWDNVTIENNCTLTTAILDVNVVIRTNVIVSPGCVLACGVVVGPDVTLPTGIKLVSHQVDTESPDLKDASEFSKGGEGSYRYCSLTSHDEDDAKELWDTWGSKVESDDDNASTEESEEEDQDKVDKDRYDVDEAKMFYDEVMGTLDRALDENIGSDNVILEINSVKHAYGIQIKELTMLVTKALLELPIRTMASSKGSATNAYLAEFKMHFNRFTSLFRNYVRSQESEKTAMLAVEEFASSNEVVLSCLPAVVSFLYNIDVISEEVILEWWKMVGYTGRNQLVRKKLEPFVQWLQTAEEEDSD